MLAGYTKYANYAIAWLKEFTPVSFLVADTATKSMWSDIFGTDRQKLETYRIVWDPKDRLGCHPQTGFADIQGHAFFRNVDWDLMEQKQIVPPFKPNICGEFGLDNFDAQFTNEPVQLTPDDEDIVRKIDQSEFEGFEYINPLLMSAEECV